MRSYWSKGSARSTSASEAGGRFSFEVVERRSGLVVMRFTGIGARELFEGEAGGHRWQRISPTEKRGRVHSSTITVAILDEESRVDVVIRDRDLEWPTCRSPGPAGQNVQKTDSAMHLVHVPTGTPGRGNGGTRRHS